MHANVRGVASHATEPPQPDPAITGEMQMKIHTLLGLPVLAFALAPPRELRSR